MRSSTLSKALALAALLLLPALSAGDASAHLRRHRHVRAHVWVHGRFVVGRPVVVTPVIVGGRPHGVIDFDVEPEETRVYVDGELRGMVDDFDGAPGKLHLLPGAHRIKLESPDGETWAERLRVVAGHEINIKLEMED